MNIYFKQSCINLYPLIKESITHSKTVQKTIVVALLLICVLQAFLLYRMRSKHSQIKNTPLNNFNPPLNNYNPPLNNLPLLNQPNLNQYNPPLTTQEIRFFDRGQPFYELTNFYENWQTIDSGEELIFINYCNTYFFTAEHAFQASKFNWNNQDAQEICSKIRKANSAREAFDLAQNNKHLMRPDWHHVKDGIMLDIQRCKYQDPYLSNILKQTGRAKLLEANPNDPYWGIGPDGNGKNKLGKILETVRFELFGF